MLCLHIWLLLVRLRAEGEDGKELAQMLYENFTDDVEMRVRAEGVKVRVGKWLAELERMFYGSSVAYDKVSAEGARTHAHRGRGSKLGPANPKDCVSCRGVLSSCFAGVAEHKSKTICCPCGMLAGG
jgi:hypothetical protein